MSTLPEVRGAQPGVESALGEPAPRHPRPDWEVLPRPRPRPRLRLDREQALAALEVLRYPLTIFLLTRIAFLLVAVADTFLWSGWSFTHELYQWDGKWYGVMAVHGYPNYVDRTGWSTLGFFPLYTIVMLAASWVTQLPYLYGGLIVSLITGAGATVLVGRLAARWFGETAARRAIVFFCLFPGSIVFSMVYTEGLLIMLVAGCLLALEDRRWLLAGVLAGLSTAVGPVGLAIVPACGVAALLELRRTGWHDRRAWRAVVAPLLAPTGIVAFGTYLWIHTGTPFASYIAQHDAWGEHSGPLALYFQASHLVGEIFSGHWVGHDGINLNIVAGLFGAAFLVWGLRYLWRARRLVSAGAITWTLGVAFLTVTSDQVPPNARMLICAFPVLVVIAAQVSDKVYRRLLGWSGVLLVGMSLLTYVGSTLRP